MGIQSVVEERGGVVVDWYVDDGFSAEGLDCPASQRMLADAEPSNRGVLECSSGRLIGCVAMRRTL